MADISAKVLEQVSEHLGKYVYVLLDPRDGLPFYVGKGQGVRLAAHGLETEQADKDKDPAAVRKRKVTKFQQIRDAGHEPQIWILRYGLGAEYTEVEAAAIDLLLSFPVRTATVSRAPLGEMAQLTNERREANRGQGLVSLDRLVDEFAAPPLEPQCEALLLITLKDWTPVSETIPGGGAREGYGFNRAWLDPLLRERDIKALADSTRCWWIVSEDHVERAGIEHAVAVYRGVTRALFHIVPGSWVEQEQGAGGTRRRGFEATPIMSGALFDSVVGQHGHRCQPKARGDQSVVNYWAALPD